MATHSSILAWRIPWTEEPCIHGIASVGRDIATKPPPPLFQQQLKMWIINPGDGLGHKCVVPPQKLSSPETLFTSPPPAISDTLSSRRSAFKPCNNHYKSAEEKYREGRREAGRELRVSPLVQTVKNQPAMRETWVRSLGWEDPLEEDMATRSSILA